MHVENHVACREDEFIIRIRGGVCGETVSGGSGGLGGMRLF